MDLVIRTIQSHELPALLDLYKDLNPNDPLPNDWQLQQVWTQLLSDPKSTC